MGVCSVYSSDPAVYTWISGNPTYNSNYGILWVEDLTSPEPEFNSSAIVADSYSKTTTATDDIYTFTLNDGYSPTDFITNLSDVYSVATAQGKGIILKYIPRSQYSATAVASTVTQVTDNLVVRYKNLAKELDGGTGQKTILKFAKNLNNTKGNGLAMHGVYREIRDLYYSVLKNPNQTVETRSQLKVLKSMYKELDTLMAKDNPAYKKAQKAWIAYNDAYVKPITKGSATEIVSSLSKVKNELSPETAGKMWKFLDTKAAPSDIALFAKAINKSGVPGLWEDIASQYFNRAFLNSQAKHLDNGLSGGVLFHDAIMKHPKQKANFVEMLYQLAKTYI